MSTTITSAPAVDTLLSRRSIRKFKPDAIDPQTVDTLEAVAQHAASSQFLNDWSAIRITESQASKRSWLPSDARNISPQPHYCTFSCLMNAATP